HADQLIARYHAFPRYMDQYLEDLRDGVRDGRTATRMATERVVGQLRALLATPPPDSALAAPATAAISGKASQTEGWAMDATQAEALLDRAKAALPRAFGRLPKIPCVVKPIEDYREKDSVAAFYYPPSGDGSRPGVFYVNTYDPPSRPRHTMAALTFHEAVPGHHLQIALATENTGLPAFRRLGADVTAYVEGWALYTERLADELGLYPDDRARFGMLGYQAWRACRLVVDTGMHHLRWSRQQGIDFFLSNVGLTERETVNEVDRYIIWPGQALSYKVGQREIESLRRAAAATLGERFDVKAFHDEVLRHGAIPLSTLRAAVQDWTARVLPA
ncbi:MAG: DUF885 domain-containing protein, partial [Chloroflexota bacterium]